MSTTTVPTTNVVSINALAMDDVIEAMRSVQTEADRWHLAEALAKQIPSGLQGFNELIDKATAEGVAGKLTVNTLRLYRDAAVRWPADKRVPNISFSAHREAMVLESIDAAAKMLADLAKSNGPSNVTVASVRKAIAVKQGKVPAVAAGVTTTNRKALDVLADIKAGAPELIDAISPATEPAELDQLHSGLTKAIAHVERLRAKAARKAQSGIKAAKAALPSEPVKATKPAARKAAGDLRGF